MPARVPDVPHALAQARALGAQPHLMGPVTSKAQALDAIAAALSFPAWYGRNLDALYDCLTDLSWQPDGEHVLVWADHGQLETADPDAYRAILAVLTETQNPRLTVLLADS